MRANVERTCTPSCSIKLEEFLSERPQLPEEANPRSVFVVHGRNGAVRDAMFAFLRSLDLSPMEWTRAVELTGEGSPYIGQVLDTAFDNATAIVVLMTPDEVAYLRPEYGHGDGDRETEPAAQARPNVLFEAGMAMGRDSKRTVLVEVGSVRPFSDVAGRHAVRLSNETSHRQELANRLRTAGCAVDITGTDWHKAGDFSPPDAPGNGMPLGRRVPSAIAAKKSIDFDLRYVNRGGNRVDKLQIINRGQETAYDVRVELPADGALNLHDAQAIAKIPGGGRAVTVDVLNHGRMFSGHHGSRAFDVTIRARSEDGREVAQDIFIDTHS
jgi:predicted nucleotide-binding protein